MGGQYCRCGDTEPDSTWIRPANDCNEACTGNSNINCGGCTSTNFLGWCTGWRMDIYSNGGTSTTTTTTTPMTTTTTPPTTTITTTATTTISHTTTFTTTTTSTLSPSNPCAPYMTQKLIPDPSDPSCTTYLNCNIGVSVATQQCGPGTKFSLALQTCAHAATVPNCDIPTTTTATMPTTITTETILITTTIAPTTTQVGRCTNVGNAWTCPYGRYSSTKIV